METRHRHTLRRRSPRKLRRLLVSLSVGLMAAAISAGTVSLASAESSACPLDRQLMAGAESCSPVCNNEGTAACIAHNSGSNACVFTNASSVTVGCPLMEASGCLYQCLPWVETTQMDAFTFYITPSTSRNTSDWRFGKLRQNEQYVVSIGAIAVPDRIQYVTFLGGASVEDNDQNSTVDVRVALSLSGQNVTNLTLANLNMAADVVPSIRLSTSVQLESLSIVNSRLGTVPIDAPQLKSLRSLDLSQNVLTAFPKEYSIESLRYLAVKSNRLRSFEATFPSLQSLDLSGNQLEAIPGSLHLWNNLKSLDLSGNPLVNATLTRAQYAFLSGLASLRISDFSTDPVCDDTHKKLLKTHVVCVLDPPDATTKPQTLAPSGSSSSSSSYLPTLIVAAVVVVLLVTTVWYFRRQKSRTNVTNSTVTAAKTTSTQNSNFLGHFVTLEDDVDTCIMMKAPSSATTPKGAISASTSRSLWDDEHLLACQLRYEDIHDLKQIGTGAFGVVWLVRYRESRLLASKRLVKDKLPRERTLEFVAEIKLNAQLDHPSIVQFVGAAWTVETDLQALFEYMPSGDLREYLDKTRSDPSHLEWTEKKLQMAIDITEALVYVHSFTQPLVHRDLKSKNVLLSKEMKTKLSDFGSSRFQSQNATMTTGVGTGRWLAPEVLAGDGTYDEMCDIYSLGVVFSELDTHALPYEELKQADVATLQAVLLGQTRPRFNDSCPSEIRELADRCSAADPAARPKAMEVVFKLRTYLKTVQLAE